MPLYNLISLTPPTLPTGYCPASYQELTNVIISGTVATFNSNIGNTFFNTGSSLPSVDNQIYPWLDDQGLWWVFRGGAWARIHPVSPNSSERRIFVGSTNDLLSYDGGDGTSGTPTDYSGAMWEVDTAFEAKFPVGAGTFANSGVVAVGDSTTSTAVTGEDQHTLTVAEMPEHSHLMVFDKQDTAGGDQLNTVYNGTDAGAVADGVERTSNTTGDDAAHNNLPPFYGVYFIKRTARLYYVK